MNYDKIFMYIPFFESEEKKYEFIISENSMPYYLYNKALKDFIRLTYKLDILDKSYLTNYDKIKEKYPNKKMIEIIEIANLEEVLTILTFYIRGDRFCDGMLANACDEKILLEILRRIKFIRESDS